MNLTKLRTLAYISRQSLFNALRNKMMLVASLVILVATMFIFGAIFSLTINVTNQIDKVVKNEYELSVELDYSITDQQSIYFENILKKDNRIERYKMISKEEAYEDFRSNYPPDEFDFIFKDSKKDFLPVSFNIKLKNSRDSSKVVDDLLKINIEDLTDKAVPEGDETAAPGTTASPGPSGSSSAKASVTPSAKASAKITATAAPKASAVKSGVPASPEASADISGDDGKKSAVWQVAETDNLVNSMKNFSRTVGIIFTIILGILSFYSIIVISNTIMLTVLARKREIEIMQNVGATSAYIRGPFLIEGCLIGIIGAIIAFFIIGFAYNALSAAMVRELSGSAFLRMTLLDFNSFKNELLVYFLIFSTSIGGFGALLSVNKYIRK